MTNDAPSDEFTTIPELLDAMVSQRDRRLIEELLRTTTQFVHDETDTLNLKIAAAALAEMREAFEMFQPYSGVPKVAIFGSARTKADDPLYAQAREVAERLAGQGGW
ncbi:MAG: hypothetical protein R2715_09460 [Ilumatobacteraceae bacterium]